ncbi:MAG: ankyrin repeat domain-containing protein [Bacteriovorax sp.]|nr:ankyrin repeat domain-containing protein [Bacteriovorax sp.]
MIKFIFLIFSFLTISFSSAEVITCSKDYSNSDVDPAYRLKDFKIQYEKYFTGSSLGALQAKGQIGYAGIRSQVKRYYSQKKFLYKSLLDDAELNLILTNNSKEIDSYNGILTLDKGSSHERVLTDLHCTLIGTLDAPFQCAETQAKNDQSLFDAILTSDLDEVNYTLECGADTNSVNKVGCTPLLNLLDSQCGTRLTRSIYPFSPMKLNQLSSLLIDSGTNIEGQDPINQQTALHKAVLLNNSDVVKMLVDLEANINSQDSNGLTPLMLSVFSGDYFLVNDLLTANANIELKNKKGKTAYDLAKDLGREDIAELLLPVKSSILISGNSNDIGCSVSKIELVKNEVVEIILKSSSNKMFRLLSPELGIDLMAQPNEKIKARYTPNSIGTFNYICGPHGAQDSQQTKGVIIIK